ncbi:hypothetical protein [Nocardia panacis]|nr:hypothetical protein [Nocardia panacis]
MSTDLSCVWIVLACAGFDGLTGLVMPWLLSPGGGRHGEVRR